MNAVYALPAVRPGAPPVDFIAARQQMLDCQIKPDNIIQPTVLRAMAETPRENYVPSNLQDRAYGDRTLEWENGFLMQPRACGMVMEKILPSAPHHVLVIESGAGYMAALAAQIFLQVTVLFADVGAAKVALNNYAKAGYDNITVKSGLLARGWARNAPYDAIILAGACSILPDAWVEQLADDGHVIGFFPDDQDVTRLQLMLKKHGVISGCKIADGQAPYLQGLAPIQSFKF
jgi:protein-L-isoaspartate(D-aspartate) O-methyltransferase